MPTVVQTDLMWFLYQQDEPIKVAEWNNPPAVSTTKTCMSTGLEPATHWSIEECHLFLYGADPYPEMVEGDSNILQRTQIFYVPLGFESWNLCRPMNSKTLAANTAMRILSNLKPPVVAQSSTTTMSSISTQLRAKNSYISYWDAGLRIVDVSNLLKFRTKGISGLKIMKSDG